MCGDVVSREILHFYFSELMVCFGLFLFLFFFCIAAVVNIKKKGTLLLSYYCNKMRSLCLCVLLPTMHILHEASKTIKAIKSVQFFSQRTSSIFDPSRLALTANSRSTPCRQWGLVDQCGSWTSEPFTKVSVYLLCCQFRMGSRIYVWMRLGFFCERAGQRVRG